MISSILLLLVRIFFPVIFLDLIFFVFSGDVLRVRLSDGHRLYSSSRLSISSCRSEDQGVPALRGQGLGRTESRQPLQLSLEAEDK